MSSKFKKNIIIFLIFLEVVTLFLTFKSFLNRNIEEEKEINKIDNKKFAMYVEISDGNYQEYTDSEYFPSGYNLNTEKTVCIDNQGNSIVDTISSTNGNITINSNMTLFCYLYFDKP